MTAATRRMIQPRLISKLQLLRTILVLCAGLSHNMVQAQIQFQPPLPEQVQIPNGITQPQESLSVTNAREQDLYMDAMRSIAEGHRDDASQTLRRMVRQEPQHAGAWLDLALIQCELGNGAEAERLFKLIEERFAPPPVILAVIAARREVGCKAWEAHSTYAVAIGRGYDTNVNQGASSAIFTIGPASQRIELELLPEYLPQQDQFTLLTMGYRRTISSNGAIVFAQFEARQNDHLARQNTTASVGGIDVPWRWNDWTLHGMASLAMVSLGGQMYQVQSHAQTELTHAVTDRIQAGLIASVTNAVYPTQSNFNSNTLELGQQISYQNTWSFSQANLSYLTDHALGPRPGGDRHGWLVSLGSRFRLSDRILGELNWSHQNWQSDSAYSPGLIDQARHEDTQIWRSGLSYQLAPHQSLLLEWRTVHNNENISIFQYRSQQIKLSWQWQAG